MAPHRIDDEIQFHIEQQTQKNIRAGMSPADARRAALLKFGGVEQAREAARDETRFAWAGDFIRDLRTSFRALRRLPSFAAAAILTFGLGLGAAVAMFAVVHGVLLQPLPYPQSDRIVQLFQLNQKGSRGRVSGPNFGDWRSGTHVFSAMAMYANYGDIPVTGLGEPRMVATARVAQRFFDVMGVQPAAGRLFAADEYREPHPHVAVISNALAAQISASGSPLGTRLVYDGESITIVGVMPKDFDYPVGTALWLPLDEEPGLRSSRTAHNFAAVARLADGVTLRAANAEISTLSRNLKAKYRDDTWMFDAAAVPILEVMTGSSKTSLEILLAAAVLLLVVATMNVSNMLVARSASRRQEFAVQLAIGASSGRIMRQLLAETLALCTCGALFGLVVAAAAVRLFAALGPDSAPRLDRVAIDWTSAVAAAGAAIAVSAVLAAITALTSRPSQIAPVLTEQSRGGSAGRRQMRLRESLIVLEIALTLVLLAAGGLFARSLANVLAIDPGFRTDDALIADLTMNSQGDDGLVRRVQDQGRIIERLSALPGVDSVGFIDAFPIGKGFFANGQFVEMTRVDEFTKYAQIEALGAAVKPRLGSASYRLANAGYFKAMGIPLLRGRLFEDSDGPDAPCVGVISASLAQQKWPGRDPLGRYVQFGNMDGDMRGIRIVGVVGDVREATIEQTPPAILYVAFAQRPWKGENFSLVVRGPRPDTIAASVRQIVHDVSPITPVHLRSTVTALDEATGARRFNFWLIGAFAVAALVLAALGVYGLVSFIVVQRTREMGIRMALGAQPGALARLIVSRGLLLAVIGAALGMALALALTGTMQGLLFGVTANDPMVHAAVVVMLMVIVSIASAIPARRILKQTPGRTLRDI